MDESTELEVLSLEEVQAVIMAAIRGTGRPCSERELRRAVRWAHTARVEASLLALVLAGDVLVRIDRRELEFRALPRAS